MRSAAAAATNKFSSPDRTRAAVASTDAAALTLEPCVAMPMAGRTFLHHSLRLPTAMTATSSLARTRDCAFHPPLSAAAFSSSRVVESTSKRNVARDHWFNGMHAPRPNASPGGDREARLRKLDIYGTMAEKHVRLTRSEHY